MRIVREWIVVSGQGAVQAARRADGEHRPLQMVFMFAARGGWAAIIRPVKRGVGDAAPYMQGEVYYNFVVCNAVRPYRLFYCYSLP